MFVCGGGGGGGVLGKAIQQPIILPIPKQGTETRKKNATHVQEPTSSKSSPKWNRLTLDPD